MDNKPSFRTKKVELSIKRLVSEYLVTQKDYLLKFPNVRFEITEVRVSKDLRFANVYLMPLGGKDKDFILDNMNKKKYIFQKYLSEAKLQSKFTPKIKFFIDDTFDEAEKIKKLLLDKKVSRDLNE